MRLAMAHHWRPEGSLVFHRSTTLGNEHDFNDKKPAGCGGVVGGAHSRNLT